MNRKLTDQQIVSTFEALRRTGGTVTGRALRAALRAQFGISSVTAKQAEIDSDDQINLAALQAAHARRRNILHNDSDAGRFG